MIEGLEGDRFAIYFKVHHSLVNGFTGSGCSRAACRRARTTATRSCSSPSSVGHRVKRTTTPTKRSCRRRDTLLHSLRAQVASRKDVGRALLNVVRSTRAHDGNLVSPLQAPKSMLNQRISRSRRFATQSFEVDRLRRLAKRAGGTLNDVVLALLASALRRFLLEQDALPDKTLTAMLPVNVRPKDDPGGGNAVGAILASLATDIADPSARLDAIIASTTHAKEQLQGMSKNAIMQYGALLIAPILAIDDPRRGRARAARVQRGRLERSRARDAAVLPWLEARSDLPGVDPVPRARAEHHRRRLRGQARLRLHRMQGRNSSPPAARGRTQATRSRSSRMCGESCDESAPRWLSPIDSRAFASKGVDRSGCGSARLRPRPLT